MELDVLFRLSLALHCDNDIVLINGVRNCVLKRFLRGLFSIVFKRVAFVESINWTFGRLYQGFNFNFRSFSLVVRFKCPLAFAFGWLAFDVKLQTTDCSIVLIPSLLDKFVDLKCRNAKLIFMIEICEHTDCIDNCNYPRHTSSIWINQVLPLGKRNRNEQRDVVLEELPELGGAPAADLACQLVLEVLPAFSTLAFLLELNFFSEATETHHFVSFPDVFSVGIHGVFGWFSWKLLVDHSQT